jgi:hypothetical protein
MTTEASENFGLRNVQREEATFRFATVPYLRI